MGLEKTMITLFPPLHADTDRSIFYLGRLYGQVGPVKLLNTDVTGNLFSLMFEQISTVCLTLGSLLVVYITVMGLLKTAQEGEFLGKQWNSMWVPLRTVMGITALFPVKTGVLGGYCAMQVIVMWIIVQGVYAADNLWQQVVNF